MTQKFLRAYCNRAEIAVAQPGTPIRFIASTEQVARDGMVIEAQGWQLDNYRANPVFMWAHDYSRPPIGRVEPNINEGKLLADVTFDQADDFARQVEQKYRDGFLSAVSVGWNTLDMKPGNPPRITRAELLDVSAVPVPADPLALKERQVRGWLDLQQALDEVLRERASYPWDQCMADMTDKYGDEETAKKVCGMIKAKYGSFDPGNETERDHVLEEIEKELDITRPKRQSEDHWLETTAAMVALFTPGSDDDDTRQAKYKALLPKYRRLDKTPPEFLTCAELTALSETEIRGLFLHGEYPEQQRIGAVLSARNRADLEQIITLAQGIMERASKEEPLQDNTPPAPRVDLVEDTTTREILAVLRLKQIFDGG